MLVLRLFFRRLGHRRFQRSFSSAPWRRIADDKVRIVEVGPRDGLQNEKKTISLETKIQLISKLAKTGVRDIEAGSFVSPKWVPQMANSAEVLQHILEHPPASDLPIAYNFLVPNLQGLRTFLEGRRYTQVPNPIFPDKSASDIEHSAHTQAPAISTEISVFTAATESFSKANLNCTIRESLERCKPIISFAKSKDIRVRGYVSVALGCPYEGPSVSASRVTEVTETLLDMGVYEVSIADTSGMGQKPRIQDLFKSLKAAGIGTKHLAFHFHDTYGQALVNTTLALEYGIRKFDSSVGGLGGCPYAKGATGNVATEDLVYMLHSLGAKTGVDLEEMAKIGAWISTELGRANDSRVGKAILARISEA